MQKFTGIFSKKFAETRCSKKQRANDSLSCGFPPPGIALGVAPRVVVFALLKSRDAVPRMRFLIFFRGALKGTELR